ncbi:MAG: hypothetical protein ACLFVP_01115 [Candidatus Bathyarchaeia archaeon]
MLDNLEGHQFHGIIVGFVVVTVVAFFAGSVFGGDIANTFRNKDSEAPNGDIEIGDAASKEEIKQNVQSFMDLQLEQQRQQLAMIVAQNENISEDDVSIDASVNNVLSSVFGSFYKVTVDITGTVPSQTGELRDLENELNLFISQDGRYLFQEPIDLKQDFEQPPQ